MSIYAMLGVEFFSHSFTPRVYEKESSVSGGVGCVPFPHASPTRLHRISRSHALTTALAHLTLRYTDDAWIFDPESDMYRTADDKYECPVNLLDNEVRSWCKSAT